MIVIWYQLFISISIVICHFVKKDKVLALCIGWSIFTIVNLFYPPLIFVQLLVIWGTRYLLVNNGIKDEKIFNLEELLKEKPLRTQELANSVPESGKKIISGLEHKEFLESCISDSNKSLVIFSGWLSDYVINDSFINNLDGALKRGCQIYIGYGWKDSSGKHKDTWPTKRAVESIMKLKKKYGNLIHVGKFSNHEKILIKDSEIVVYGSNNWLSNNRFENSERSIAFYNNELAIAETERAIEVISKHEIA